MTTPQPPPAQPSPMPVPLINLNATPDGKYVVLSTTIFIEIAQARQLGEALVNMTRQLATGLIIPNNGQPPP